MSHEEELTEAPKDLSRFAFLRQQQKHSEISQLSSLANRAQVLFPFFLVALGFATIYYRFNQQVVQGPGWDPFAFLANALEFAGRGIGYSELHRPPLISLLTSFLFRAGFVSESALFAVDGALVLLGIIGFYKLLKLRFPAWLSFLGTFLFLSFPPIIGLATTGYTDLPSTAISIWAIYFFVLALEKDRRYHWVAWPTLTLAMLTRFTGFLLIIPVLPLLVSRASVLRNLKDIAIGLSLSLLISLPALIFYYLRFGDPIFPFAHAFFAATETPPTENFALSRDLGWFLVNMKTFVLQPRFYGLYPALLALVVLGLSWRFFSLTRKADRDVYHNLLLAFVLAFYLLIFFKANFTLRQVSLVVLGIVLYQYFEKTGRRFVMLDVLFFLWFMTYFDFHGHDPIKIERYFVVMAPGVAFFILEGLESLANLSSKRTFRVVLSAAIAISLGLGAIVSIQGTLAAAPERDSLIGDAMRTTSWLKRNDPQISGAKIYSDLWPVFSWYLKQRVDPMPFFKDSRAFDHELQKYDVDYYLTVRNRSVPSFKNMVQIGSVEVLKRDPHQHHDRIRILYLGMNWEHYLEDVLDFKYFVMREAGKYYLGKSLYLDGYTLQELSNYPLIALYNFKWHDRKRAETLLRNYVSSGGNIIVDATGNNGGMPYNLEGDTFLGVSVLRKALSAKPTIRFSSDLPVSDLDFTSFLSHGNTWWGMTYQNLDRETPFHVLATANGEPLIATQRMGRGKIIWIGFNLVWHSFYKKNREEQQLIQRLFSYALQRTL